MMGRLSESRLSLAILRWKVEKKDLRRRGAYGALWWGSGVRLDLALDPYGVCIIDIAGEKSDGYARIASGAGQILDCLGISNVLGWCDSSSIKQGIESMSEDACCTKTR